jgi:50S ribosomal protein L16 3-hydroxylase
MSTLLGGLAPRVFLARHWQKKPLLVRGALPKLRDPVTVALLYALAGRDDAESRLVTRTRARWTLDHGPFTRSRLRDLPARNWTLLVQGLNLFVPAAQRLLERFAFIPWARLDDVMASYAAPGGGVGPHLDSYDVFLVQGRGRRRWRISAQRDLEVDPRAPLKVLRGFRAEAEWVLEPGDMLYLPPGVAHEGIALEASMTYSIGFRAPGAQELAGAFFTWLQEHVALAGRYADPDLKPAVHPGRLPEDMVERVARVLARVRWSRTDVARFLATYLSEPKAQVLFEPPRSPLSARAFASRAARCGVALALPTMLLVRRDECFINGECVRVPRAAREAIAKLADRRTLAAAVPTATGLLYTWYRAGYVLPGSRPSGRS